MNRQLRTATAHTVSSDLLALLLSAGTLPQNLPEGATSATYTVSHRGTTVATGTCTLGSTDHTVSSVTARTQLTCAPSGESVLPTIGSTLLVSYATGRAEYRRLVDAGRASGESTVDTLWIDRGVDSTPSQVSTSSVIWALTAVQTATAMRDATVDIDLLIGTSHYYVRDVVDIVATPLQNPCTIDEFVQRWPGYVDRSRLPSSADALLAGVWDEVCARVVAAGLKPDAIISLEQLTRPTYAALAYRLASNGYYPGSHDDTTSLREEFARQAADTLESCLSYVSAYDSVGEGDADTVPLRRGVIRLGR